MLEFKYDTKLLIEGEDIVIEDMEGKKRGLKR